MTQRSMAMWSEVLAAVAAPDGIGPAFALSETITRREVGCRLYTVMTSDPVAGFSARVHSSDPKSYPVSGRKPMVPNAWTRTVLDAKQPFLANTIQEIAEVFPDHELIRSLGCESCLNVPVIVGGEVRGTINILDEGGHFTPARVAAAMALRPLYTLVLTAALLDHDVFGSNRYKDMNVIDSNNVEHDVVRKPVPTFRHHALAEGRR